MTEVRAVNTPGLCGYVLVLLISYAAFVGPLALMTAVGGELEWAMAVLMVGCAVAFTIGTLVAAPALVVVHFCCRYFPEQLTHVLATGLAGMAAGTILFAVGAYGSLAVGYFALPTIAGMGIAAGIGRLAVVPLVNSRRRLAAQGQLTGTARW